MAKTLVWRYGLLPPTRGSELVRKQLRWAWEYRRDLTLLRRAQRAALRDLEPDGYRERREAVRASDAECKALAQEIKDMRARVGRSKGRAASEQERRNRAEGKAMRAKLRGMRASVREQRKVLRAEWQAAKKEMQAERDAIGERWRAMHKSVRAHYSRRGQGLRHGTYTRTEQELDAACRAGLWDGAEPSDPRYPRWTGEGSVRVQIQGGCPQGKIGTHTALQIDHVPDLTVRSGGKRDPSSPAPKASHRWGRLRLRVGTDEDTRGPIWAEWPAVLHRPVPTGATVMEASVHVRRVGDREQWSATLTLRLPAGYRRESCGDGVVGVRLGWRCEGVESVEMVRRDRDAAPDIVDVPRLVVAEWSGDDGGSGELVLPPKLVARMLYPETLREIRDKRQDQMRPTLLGWLREQSELPEWMPSLATMARWRAPGRWSALLRQWSGRRWDGDGEGYGVLFRWEAKDRHLHEWEARQRQSAIRWRRDLYRTLGARLARRYGALAVPDTRYSELARRGLAQDPARSVDAPDDGQDMPQSMRHHRTLASVAELRDALEHAMRVRGGDVVRVQGDEAPAVVLSRGIERLSEEREAAAARNAEKSSQKGEIGETRWARAKRLRQEKEKRMATARNAGDICAG